MTTVEEAPAATTEIGKDRRRKEDQRLITGRTRWTDNLSVPGMLHMAMVRSPHAHARILGIDTSAAERLRQRRRGLHRRRARRRTGLAVNAWPITADQKAPPHPPVAVDRVAFAGEIVAVVVARTAAEARDAAELVDVDYEVLPAALDLKEAAEDRCWRTLTWAPTRAPSGGSTAARPAPAAASTRRSPRRGRTASSSSGSTASSGSSRRSWSRGQRAGRPDRRADHHVELDPDPAHRAVPLAATTGVPESKIRVIAPDVGGGFGGKLQTTPEEWSSRGDRTAAREAGQVHRDPSESMVRGHHGRAQWQKLTLAAEKDGTVTGLKVELDSPTWAPTSRCWAAASRSWAPSCSTRSTSSRPTSSTARPCFTNKTWTDAYRGAGRPEATFAIERVMDELAAQLGVDPLEIREKNWIKHEEFPFTTVAGLDYDSGNYEAATAKAKEMFGYDDLRAEQQKRRESGDRVQLGIGISTFTEMCGLAPSKVVGSLAYGAGGWDHATVRMLAPARSRWSPASARTARATRRRSARSWPTGSAYRSRTSRCCTATPRSPPGGWTPTAPGRWSRRRGGGPCRRQGDREGEADRGAPARGQRRRRGVRRGALHGRAAPTRASRIGELALADVRRAQLAGRRGGRRSTRTPPSTR